MTADELIIDITDPEVIAGLFIGGMLTFLFSALTMTAVGKAAQKWLKKLEDSSENSPELWIELKNLTTRERCVEISTRSSLKQMVAPGVAAIVIPVLVGIFSALGVLEDYLLDH